MMRTIRCLNLTFNTYTTMFIYKVIFYNHFDSQFHENYHKLFKNLDDAKKYVKTHLEENYRIFRDNNFHYCENDYEYGNRVYMVTTNRDGDYNNIIKEKIEIHKEQVY